MHLKTGVFPPSAILAHFVGVHSIYARVNLISVGTYTINTTDELKVDENTSKKKKKKKKIY